MSSNGAHTPRSALSSVLLFPKMRKNISPPCHLQTLLYRPAPPISRSAHPETPAQARPPGAGPGTPLTWTPPQSAGGWSCWPRHTAGRTSWSRQTGARPGSFWGEAFWHREGEKKKVKRRNVILRHARVGSEQSYRMGKIHKLGPQLCWKLPGWHRPSLSGTPLVKGIKLRQILFKDVCLMGLGCRQGGQSSMGSPAKHLSGENGAHSGKLCFPSGVDILGWRFTSGHWEGPEVVEWEFKPHAEMTSLTSGPFHVFPFFLF